MPPKKVLPLCVVQFEKEPYPKDFPEKIISDLDEIYDNFVTARYCSYVDGAVKSLRHYEAERQRYTKLWNEGKDLTSHVIPKTFLAYYDILQQLPAKKKAMEKQNRSEKRPSGETQWERLRRQFPWHSKKAEEIPAVESVLNRSGSSDVSSVDLATQELRTLDMCTPDNSKSKKQQRKSSTPVLARKPDGKKS